MPDEHEQSIAQRLPRGVVGERRLTPVFPVLGAPRVEAVQQGDKAEW